MTLEPIEEDDREELRLALVMNGGVSLAVWMGGVTTEINRLRQRQGAYGEALDLLVTTARVDVISGSSAGGLNGALLATAIAHRQPLDSLRDLWVQNGGLDGLLRSPTETDAPSLLQGDERFLDQLRDAFDDVGQGRLSEHPDDQLRLALTVSVMQGRESGLTDDYGSRIPDVNHRGLFRFERTNSTDDWAIPGVLDRLALAGRSSASFPGAFEPSWVPVGAEGQRLPTHPNMGGYFVDAVNRESVPGSRYVVDGGALVNKPFGPALDDMYAQPATRPVRRVVVYVCPDPGREQEEVAEGSAGPPDLLKTLWSSLITMPRAESVAAELKRISTHNDQVSAWRSARALLFDGESPRPRATAMWDAYRAQRARHSVERTLAEIDSGVYELLPEVRALWNRKVMAGALRNAREDLLGRTFAEAAKLRRWRWGIESVETAAMTVLDILTRSLIAAPMEERDVRKRLREARGRVHAIRHRLEPIRGHDAGYWRGQAASACLTTDHAAWAQEVYQRWVEEMARGLGGDPFAAVHDLGLEVAQVLVERAADIERVADLAAGTDGKLLDQARETLVPPRATAARVLVRLLAVEVGTTVISAVRPGCDQDARLVLVSASAPNQFDGRVSATTKLTGIQLGHFGAFFKPSWRANDWLFGRLDATYKLSQMVLAPVRLRQLRYTTEQAVDLITALCHGTSERADLDKVTRAWLADPAHRALDPVAVRKELAFLDHPEQAVPARLQECARGFARRLQLDVVREELEHVRSAMRADTCAGSPTRGAMAVWALDYDAAPKPLTPADATALFRRCEISTEKIESEIGTDLFTTTFSTAVATAITVVAGRKSNLGPLRWLAGSVRMALLTFWLLAQATVRGTKSTFAAVAGLLAVGGVLSTLAIIGTGQPGWLSALGFVLVGAGIAVAWLQAGTRLGVLLIVLLTLVCAAAPYLLLPAPSDDGDDGWRRVARPVLAVGALVVVPQLTSGVVRRVRRRRAAVRSRASTGAGRTRRTVR